MVGEGKVVCVTGASGYIASWLVKKLLLRGYTVKATVRNLNDPSKTEHLVSLEGAKERLHLFKADLLEDNIFDSIIDGCDGVFHTACPVVFAVSDPQSELIDPAVKGTLNVLLSCARSSSVKRVVITSSLASVAFNRTPLTPDVVIDETWFTDPTLAQELKYCWYVLAKTLAEKAAWQFAEENGIDLITIHPGWVFGPLLQPTLNTSVRELLNIINGKESVPDGIYVCTDIRDVVEAHIQALEIPSANGRYLMVGHVMHFTGLLKFLKNLFPSLRVTERFSEHLLYDKSLEPTYRVSTERAKSLDIDFIPLEVCLKDTIESLVVKNLISL